MNKKERALEILRRLKKMYPEARTALHSENPFELLVATILSAQCTDERVNKVTRELFKKYRAPEDYIKVSREEIEQDIKSTGFYRNKAKSIQEAAAMIVKDFKGNVPDSMEDLLKLPGVARKTANVVLGNYFGIAAGIVVDTHVQRLSGRLGLSEEKNAEKVEKDLMEIIPQKEWIFFGNALISHGRAVCSARKPACHSCFMSDICPAHSGYRL